MDWAASRFYQGAKGLHLPIMLWASTADKQLTGNLLRSDINRQSQVPLIQAHIAGKLALINLKPRGSTPNEMFFEGADTVNESVGYTDSLITQTILKPRADLKVPLPLLGSPPSPAPLHLWLSGRRGVRPEWISAPSLLQHQRSCVINGSRSHCSCWEKRSFCSLHPLLPALLITLRFWCKLFQDICQAQMTKQKVWKQKSMGKNMLAR